MAGRWSAVCLLMCLGITEARAQQAAPAVKVPPGLIGTWTVIEEQANGMPTTPQTGNFVVTADRCYWGKTPFSIARIETQLAPYKINLVTDGEPPVANFTVIYEQDGDKLRLSMPRGDNSQVPQQFVAKAGDPWAIFTCRRAPDISTSPLKTSPDVDATLLQAINEMLTPLEAKNMRAFFVRFIPADRSSADPSQFPEKFDGPLPPPIEQIRVTLRALLRIKPTYELGPETATFYLGAWHIPGGLPVPYVDFKRVNGKWYFQPE